MSVIPSNNSELQHILAKLTDEQIASIDWRSIMRAKNPQECEPKWLPWLAWENSIGTAEGWDFAENDNAKRNLIQDYIKKHQFKGTPSSIRRIFSDLGLGEIDIIEHAALFRYNGEADWDGTRIFGGDSGDWAKYAIVLHRVITVQQAALIKQMLDEIAPLRCELLYLDYRSEALKWDGEITFNGSYTYGAING